MGTAGPGCPAERSCAAPQVSLRSPGQPGAAVPTQTHARAVPAQMHTDSVHSKCKSFHMCCKALDGCTLAAPLEINNQSCALRGIHMRARKVLSVLAAALILSLAPTASSAATAGSSAGATPEGRTASSPRRNRRPELWPVRLPGGRTQLECYLLRPLSDAARV